jgi:hypothetical protein
LGGDAPELWVVMRATALGKIQEKIQEKIQKISKKFVWIQKKISYGFY